MKTFLKSSEEFFLFMRIATKIGRKNLSFLISSLYW